LTVAPAVLAALPLAGRLVNGDARSCQRALCRRICEQDGEYLVIVKANQPGLLWAIATLFAEPPPEEGFATAVSWGQHGDRVETRRLGASGALAGYLGRSGVRRVLRAERVCARRGRTGRDGRDAIARLGPEVGPEALLARVRGHRAIENRLHWVRDVSLGEDASQIRGAAAPQAMAARRNAVIAPLRGTGWDTIAAALRHHAWQPRAALAVLGLAPP